MSYKIGSLNVRSLTDKTKQQVIFNIFNNHQIDILAIQETNISSQAQTKAFSNSLPSQYVALLSHQTDLQRVGFGVGLIIKKSLADHIFKYHTSQGRLQIIDFQFKNKKRLRLINLYSPNSNNSLRVELYKSIKKSITEANTQGFSILLLGDLNADPNRVRNQKYSKQFFKDLDTLNLFNTRIFVPHKSDNQLYTYQGKLTRSRIDHIYISHDLIPAFFDHRIIEMDANITDHNLVLVLINQDSFTPTHNLTK